MMNPNSQFVADQLPDENQIDRLFPKCPPKQSATLYRQRASSRSRDLLMRQNKCKAQEHLRRKMEAKRNKSSSYRDVAGSSETSDENVIENNINKNNNIKKSASSSQIYANNRMRDSASTSRKSSKYMASQNLRQQIQRSSCNSSSGSNLAAEQPTRFDKSREQPANTATLINSQARGKRSTSGIIKSASSYAFTDELDAEPSRLDPSNSLAKQKSSIQTTRALSNMKNDNRIAELSEDDIGSSRAKSDQNRSILKSFKREAQPPTTTTTSATSSPGSQSINDLGGSSIKKQLEPPNNPVATNHTVVGRRGDYDEENIEDCAQQRITSPSADRGSRGERSGINVKNDLMTNDLISIGETTAKTLTEQPVRSNLNNISNSSHDSLTPPNNEDNYINLFVYDNALTNSYHESDSHIVSSKSLLTETAPSIISIHHQASQQLLSTGLNENGDGIVNNDASTEELCSSSDILDELRPPSSPKKESDDIHEVKRCSLDPRSTISKKISQKESHLAGTLQTVDESAEDFNTDVEQESDKDVELEQGNQPVMPQLNPIRRGFTPPGYPQRIQPQSTTPTNETIVAPLSATQITTKVKSSSGGSEEKPPDLNSSFSGVSHRNLRTEPQRVKFADENLVVVKGDCTKSDHVNNNAHDIHRRSENLSFMPSISESQCETELDSNKNALDIVEQDLSASLDKISFSNSIKTDISNDIQQNETLDTSKQVTCEKGPRTHESIQPQVIEPSLTTQPAHVNEIPVVPHLRHHKLPNETSHYSVIRTANNTQLNNNNISNNITNNSDLEPSRSSIVQFNTLSDCESGAEESSATRIRTFAKQRSFTSDRRITNTASLKNNDDDLIPTTKTVLVFPRIDEGLSSEPESYDDEVDDEDERAMDADVEGDDDDDDDVDDEVESDSPLGRGTQTLHLNQGTSDLNSSIGQIKSPGSSYGAYVNHETGEGDLKSNMSNFVNQNVQANYWIGASSQPPGLTSQLPITQQLNLSSHIPASHHMNTRNHNNSLSKTNNSLNRDEAKSTSRLSSDTDNETDRLLGSQRNDQLKLNNNDITSSNSVDLQPVNNTLKQSANSREVLIEGVLFNVKYLGSTHTDCEGRSEKEDRIHQAEMAVHEVKFRSGDSQSATEVQLFISTEKIMVLDDKHRKIMMDHSLRTISYIADIGDAIVLIVRKKSSNSDVSNELGRPLSKISCHVFESSESHTITKSISQAFQVAYTELLKANGTGDTSSYLPKELDYQEVLNSQEMSTDELEMFARKENQREVIVPKEKGEILGLSIVESGWGSVLPTVVIASLKHDGPAYRCKKLSVGDQILSVNGISLVGLPLAECQEILRKTKKQRVARLSVVPCPITVEVKIKRPDTKYQLGFSVQNGVICSLLRGGIAERGGVRVGHRIMSINGTTVVGVPHEKIVTLLASSVGEIRMKTCLTSLYRLILGEENPVHF